MSSMKKTDDDDPTESTELDDLEMIEQCEERRFYDLDKRSKEAEAMHVTQKPDDPDEFKIFQLFDTADKDKEKDPELDKENDKDKDKKKSKKEYKVSNPIFYSEMHANGLPKTVYAHITHDHLRTGESTSSSKEAQNLAKEIRNLGHIVNGEAVDQCGHVIAAVLGGRMERQNLYPVSKTTNISQLIKSENIIRDHIIAKESVNGRALIRVHLFYEDRHYPTRPTRFEYSYLLLVGDEYMKKKAKTQDSEDNPKRQKVPEKNFSDIEKAKCYRHTNRKSAKLINHIEKSQQPSEETPFWTKVHFYSGVALIAASCVAPTLFNSSTVSGTIPVAAGSANARAAAGTAKSFFSKKNFFTFRIPSSKTPLVEVQK